MTKYFKSLSSQIILAMLLGVLVGALFSESVSHFGEIGKVVIILIKAAATPLLFFVVMHSLLTSEISGKMGMKLILINVFNTSCALAIGIGLSKFFEAGKSLSFLHPPKASGQLTQYVGQKINFIESFKHFFPESFLKPFVDNAIISLILVALIVGLSLRKVRANATDKEKDLIESFIHFLSIGMKTFEVALTWLVHLVPLAVFGVVAKTVGEYGFAPLKGLSQYVGLGLLGFILHVGIVYQGWLLFKKIPLGEFWKKTKTTLVYAWGVNSSLATLPLTLKTLDDLKVSKESSTLGACVGTNLNNDGILLYEAMAVFFVAQAAGIEMDMGTQFMAAFVCILGTIGIAGIPEAGFITLSLVLTTLGLPVEILPMLLTVDWILGRGRSVVNVLGDMIVSIGLDKKRES